MDFISDDLPIINKFEEELKSLCKFTCFVIITDMPNSLSDLLKKNKPTIHDKLNLFFNIHWQYSR